MKQTGTMDDLTQKIEELAKPFLTEADVELVDLSVRRHKKNITIEILADKPSGGITLEECSDLNKKIGGKLEEENLISSHYILEVSSPGLDRPLKTLGDFSRVVNREICVYLSEPVRGKIEYEGIVKDTDGNHIVLECHSGIVKIPFNKINKGKQII